MAEGDFPYAVKANAIMCLVSIINNGRLETLEGIDQKIIDLLLELSDDEVVHDELLSEAIRRLQIYSKHKEIS